MIRSIHEIDSDRRRSPHLGIAWLSTLAIAFSVCAKPEARAEERGLDNVVVIEGTLEVTPAYPRVHVQLRVGERVLAGEAMKLSVLSGLKDLNDLDKFLDGGKVEHSFTAFLDTGASASVISKSTSGRFGIQAVPEAVYHETGLHGETSMGVSRPYTLALSGSGGMVLDEPGRFQTLEGVTVFQLNHKAPSNPLIELSVGEINVIGMPVIRRLVVEIDPTPMTSTDDQIQLDDLSDLLGTDMLAQLAQVGAGPAVRLHDANFRPPGVDLSIPLKYVNFARRKNPRDRGPLPDLSTNPMIVGVQTEHGGRRFSGDWLLDTGAPASIISTKHAIALGIYDRDGQANRAADFSLPLGGVGGAVKVTPGFRIDRLRVDTGPDRPIEYRGAYVIVHDVSIVLDDGQSITLDGVFGTNLLLPTVAGLSFGLPTNMAAAPFQRIWIDGPRARLLLDLP